MTTSLLRGWKTYTKYHLHHLFVISKLPIICIGSVYKSEALYNNLKKLIIYIIYVSLHKRIKIWKPYNILSYFYSKMCLKHVICAIFWQCREWQDLSRQSIPTAVDLEIGHVRFCVNRCFDGHTTEVFCSITRGCDDMWMFSVLPVFRWCGTLRVLG